MASGPENDRELLEPDERAEARKENSEDSVHDAEWEQQQLVLDQDLSYTAEMRELFSFATPIMATSLLTYFLGVVDLSMAGHLGKEVISVPHPRWALSLSPSLRPGGYERTLKDVSHTRSWPQRRSVQPFSTSSFIRSAASPRRSTPTFRRRSGPTTTPR